MSQNSNNFLIKNYLESVGDKPRTAVEKVYEDLLRRIINLELPPGKALTRGDLCKEYQVSQTPVREALLRLEQIGLIKVKPQSGTEITSIDIEQIEQNHFLREALEFEVVRRLALKPNKELIKHLRSIVDMQEQVSTGDSMDLMLFAKLDEFFHRSMFEAAGQIQLHELVRSRSGHMDRIRRLHLPHEGKIRAILESHRKIIDGIEANDITEAVNSMREHLSGTLTRVQSLKDEFPDYFLQ